MGLGLLFNWLVTKGAKNKWVWMAVLAGLLIFACSYAYGQHQKAARYQIDAQAQAEAAKSWQAAYAQAQAQYKAALKADHYHQQQYQAAAERQHRAEASLRTLEASNAPARTWLHAAVPADVARLLNGDPTGQADRTAPAAAGTH